MRAGSIRLSPLRILVAFAALAQLLSLHSLSSTQLQVPVAAKGWLKVLWGLVVAQWCIGLASLAVTIAEPSNKFQLENIVEWNFALAMVCFYGVSGELWHRLSSRPPVGYQ